MNLKPQDILLPLKLIDAIHGGRYKERTMAKQELKLRLEQYA